MRKSSRHNLKRKEPYCVPATIKPLTKTWKKESEKKHLKEKGALRRAERKRTVKNSMDEGLNKKAEKAPRTEEESKLCVISRTEPLRRGQGCNTEQVASL